MNTPSTSSELLRHALTTPTRGVLGLVDDLLAVSREHGIQLDWKADHCRVRFRGGGPPEWIEVPLRKSVVRAALARIAVLCNQWKPNSVSPYGGQGELLVDPDSTTAMRVAFVNTPDEQSLELAPLRNESSATLPEPVSEEQNQEAAQAPGSEAGDGNTSGEEKQSLLPKRYELSEEELRLLGSLLGEMLRGGRDVLLERDLRDEIGKGRVDPEQYLNAIQITIGVRPRTLNAVVIRRLMGSVINHWVRLKVSLGLIPSDDMGRAIHHAAAQFANAFPFNGGSERE